MHFQLIAYADFDMWHAWLFKNVLLLKLAKKKKTKLSALLIFLLYYTSQLAFVAYIFFSIQVCNNNIIYHFQKYICFTLFHIFLLTSALVVTLRSLSVLILLITSLLIKYIADGDVLNRLFIVDDVCWLNNLLIRMT